MIHTVSRSSLRWSNLVLAFIILKTSDASVSRGLGFFPGSSNLLVLFHPPKEVIGVQLWY